MKLHFYPGKSRVSISIDTFSFYSGFFDDYDRDDHTLTVTLSKSENIEEVIENIHNSVKEYEYINPISHIEKSVRRATKPIEGNYYSEHYKNNWERILYLRQQPGIKGWRDPNSFEITND